MALLSLAGCASTTPQRAPAPAAETRTGLEVLLADPPAWMVGKRLGLVTNAAAVDRRGRRGVDLLLAHPELRLVTLFAFEHGLAATAAPGEEVASEEDAVSGLPVHSLYGATRKPTPEMLDGLDALVFDAQEVGARTYTRLSTMALAMEAAAEAGLPFVVLDRPNPLGGLQVEGPVLDTAFASFVGMFPIPLRHGLTIGELALLFHGRFGVGARPVVIPMEGWSRGSWFDELGLPWVAPSPNLPSLESALHYPGTVLIEGTSLSEGRGTDRPFQQLGAPWLRPAQVVRELAQERLPGVRLVPVTLHIEAGRPKYGGQAVPGIRLVITDRDRYRPVATVLRLLATIRRLHPESFAWTATIDRLSGTDEVRRAVEAGDVEPLLERSAADAEAFSIQTHRYRLYP